MINIKTINCGKVDGYPCGICGADNVEGCNQATTEPYLQDVDLVEQVANVIETLIIKASSGMAMTAHMPSVAQEMIKICTANRDAVIDSLVDALKPFAQFSCSPIGECNCHNCKARDLVESLKGKQDE